MSASVDDAAMLVLLILGRRKQDTHKPSDIIKGFPNIRWDVCSNGDMRGLLLGGRCLGRRAPLIDFLTFVRLLGYLVRGRMSCGGRVCCDGVELST